MRTAYEQSANSVRTTREQRTNNARTTSANSPANYATRPSAEAPGRGEKISTGTPPAVSVSPAAPVPGAPLWWPFFPLFYILLLSSSSDISYHQLNQQDGLQPPVTRHSDPLPTSSRPTSSPRGSTLDERAQPAKAKKRTLRPAAATSGEGSMGGGFSSRCSFTHSRLYLSGPGSIFA